MSVIEGLWCVDCGKELEFTCHLDKNDNLVGSVEPCRNCIKEGVEEARLNFKESQLQQPTPQRDEICPECEGTGHDMSDFTVPPMTCIKCWGTGKRSPVA